MVAHGQHAQSVLRFVILVFCGLKKCTNIKTKLCIPEWKNYLNIPNLVAKPPSQTCDVAVFDSPCMYVYVMSHCQC